MTPPEVFRFFLSHHYPEQYERCCMWKSWYFCRRCLFLYPVMLGIFALSVAQSPSSPFWPLWWDDSLLMLLPVPATLEFCLEHFGLLSYQPRRQIGTTLLLGIALGRGFYRYLFLSLSDPLFWKMVLLYGSLTLFAFFYKQRYSSRPSANAKAEDPLKIPEELLRPQQKKDHGTS
jgi:hypothetical protein